MATLQKRLSKKQKKSNNRNKARVKVVKLHNRIKDSRQDQYKYSDYGNRRN